MCCDKKFKICEAKINSVLLDGLWALGAESVVISNGRYCYNEMTDYSTISKGKPTSS